MINPKPGDQARTVLYWPRIINRGKPEMGVLKSWNDHVVFVVYKLGGPGIATNRADLTWQFPEATDDPA